MKDRAALIRAMASISCHSAWQLFEFWEALFVLERMIVWFPRLTPDDVAEGR